jgi:hypothetical protein
MTARHLRVVHLALAALWGTAGMAYTVIWGAESILWVGIMSAYALVVSHLAAYDAARAEDS